MKSLTVSKPEGVDLGFISNIPAFSRETYGQDADNKPNDHCVWGRLLPTACSPMGWVETDDHLRQRVKADIDQNC